jgi:hypothetical protein
MRKWCLWRTPPSIQNNKADPESLQSPAGENRHRTVSELPFFPLFLVSREPQL